MYISETYFRKLDLKYGNLIYLVTETGEGFNGTYQGDFTGTTFSFNNFSNGKTQKIFLDKLQRLEKILS